MSSSSSPNRAASSLSAVPGSSSWASCVPIGSGTPGVGTGTVSRHFPTKESLYEAIVLARVEEIVARAHQLIETREPGDALFEFIAYLVEQGAASRGLAEALSSGGFDIEAAAARSEHDLDGVERTLLERAKKAGTVRPDVTNADIKALVAGCVTRERHPDDHTARHRMITIVCAGLRPDQNDI